MRTMTCGGWECVVQDTRNDMLGVCGTGYTQGELPALINVNGRLAPLQMLFYGYEGSYGPLPPPPSPAHPLFLCFFLARSLSRSVLRALACFLPIPSLSLPLSLSFSLLHWLSLSRAARQRPSLSERHKLQALRLAHRDLHTEHLRPRVDGRDMTRQQPSSCRPIRKRQWRQTR